MEPHARVSVLNQVETAREDLAGGVESRFGELNGVLAYLRSAISEPDQNVSIFEKAQAAQRPESKEARLWTERDEVGALPSRTRDVFAGRLDRIGAGGG